MPIPITGIIDRRILINYTADPAVLANYLPKPFRPLLFRERALVGICLIRLKNIRPSGFPAFTGLRSENAAHRMAVEWTENGTTRQGVYIPRRDTDSYINHLAGGRIFPGLHHFSTFGVDETESSYNICMEARDKHQLSIRAKASDEFPPKSIFGNLETASAFYKGGSVGFSPGKKKFEGLRLQTRHWEVEPLKVEEQSSSFFEDENIFPKNAVQFDHALLMRNIPHTWNSYPADCLSLT
jgi:hypothetical protein